MSGQTKRKSQFKLSSRELYILAGLGVLTLCVCGVFGFAASSFWILERNEQPSSNSSSSQVILATPRSASIATPTLATFSNAPALPEATPTAAPTETPTLVVLTPTSTDTPPPTNTPLSTDTPTPVPPTAPAPTVVALSPATATPQPQINYVVIITVDGLRPDALDLADTPTLDYLRSIGAYTSNAITVQPSATLIAHASLLSGMGPDKHGIYWNLYNPDLGKVKEPTLLTEAHNANLRTAMIPGKFKLEQLYIPHPLGIFDGTPEIDTSTDIQVRDRAISIIQSPDGLPSILFIHFPEVDVVGHNVGWLSPLQLTTIQQVDARIGEVVAALEGMGYFDNTLLILTADHGGNGTGHFDVIPENFTIPWLAVGPGVSSGMTITSEVNIFDTAATAAHALNLPLPAEWDGKPILEIFE